MKTIIFASICLLIILLPPKQPFSFAQENNKILDIDQKIEKTDYQFKFKILNEELEYNYKSYIDNIKNAIALLILAIGWVMTSEHARTFIATNKNIKNLILFAIVLLFLIHFGTLIEYRENSLFLLEEVDCLKCIETKYLNHYRIDIYNIVFASLTTFTLSTILVISIFTTKTKKETSNNI